MTRFRIAKRSKDQSPARHSAPGRILAAAEKNLRHACRFHQNPLVVLAEADERARIFQDKTRGEDRCVSW